VLQFARLFSDGKSGGREGKQAEVEIAVSDRDEFAFKGRIDFAENQLDTGTATLRFRAKVENEDEFLTPGLFARVRVPIGEPTERMLVRDEALGFDQDKRFAWVVKEGGALDRRFVETGDLADGMRVVTGGLTPDEMIAVSGIQLLQPGAVVAPTTVPMIAAE
jgi:RND family efflux transporter MFP subunit